MQVSFQQRQNDKENFYEKMVNKHYNKLIKMSLILNGLALVGVLFLTFSLDTTTFAPLKLMFCVFASGLVIGLIASKLREKALYYDYLSVKYMYFTDQCEHIHTDKSFKYLKYNEYYYDFSIRLLDISYILFVTGLIGYLLSVFI